MDRRKSKIRQIAVGMTGIIFILYGVMRGEAATVFNKAVNICLECIGLG